MYLDEDDEAFPGEAARKGELIEMKPSCVIHSSRWCSGESWRGSWIGGTDEYTSADACFDGCARRVKAGGSSSVWSDKNTCDLHADFAPALLLTTRSTVAVAAS